MRGLFELMEAQLEVSSWLGDSVGYWEAILWL